MVLGLKPMGKLDTSKKSKYYIEPRSCVVLRLRPMGKLNTSKKLKVPNRTKVFHGPQKLKPMGKLNTSKKSKY